MDDLISEFLVEAFEGLDALDQQLLALESSPDDSSIVNSIFRTVHTIKGTCGFLDFKKLEKVTHVGEYLLDKIRTAEVLYSEEVASVLLDLVDAARTILTNIERDGNEGAEEYAELIQRMEALMTGESAEEEVSPEALEEQKEVEAQDAEGSEEAPQQSSAEGQTPEEAEFLDQLDRSLDKFRPGETGSESAPGVEQHASQEEASENSEESASVEESNNEFTPTTDGTDSDVTNYELLAELLGEEAPATEPLEARAEAERAEAERAEEEVASEATQEVTSGAEASSESESDVTNYELLAELLGEESEEGGSAAESSVVETVSDEKTTVEAAPEQGEVSDSDNEVESDQQSKVAPKEEERATMSETDGKATAPEAPLVDQPTPSSAQNSVSEGATKAPPAGGRSQLADSSIRVDVGLLDQLMNLVGELVLARNQVLQFSKVSADNGFQNTCQRLNVITSELQERVMKTRMQPIANVWNKFPRVVRDVARACGKEIKLEMSGEDTDLDKTILEAIKDPLTHIVRNSADHGIETPEAREAAGKPRQGTLWLRALHEGGHVIIEIEDDGAGLNIEKIKSKALEKGLITEDYAQRLSEKKAAELIFLPGFSTADQVTNVSGRGVGMDVVRSNIERIGGQVEITTKQGHGTLLTVKIPLTLAIIPALIVLSANQRFAIPQVDLLELLRIEPETSSKVLERIGDRYFYRLRGNLLPLVHLESVLGLAERWDPAQLKTAVNIIVVRADGHDLGIVVEEVFDTEEIVVKPLGRQLQGIDVLSGAAIMGDGKVSLILDVHGIAKKSDIVVSQESVADVAEDDDQAISVDDESTPLSSLLVVRSGDLGRYSIPLEKVNRLEEMSADCLEYAGGLRAAQYRGTIMPLLSLSELVGGESDDFTDISEADLSVVVFRRGERYVGIIVREIQDIIEERLKVKSESSAEYIVGSAVVGGKVADLLDIDLLLEQAFVGSDGENSIGGASA